MTANPDNPQETLTNMSENESPAPGLRACIGAADKIFSWAQFLGLCAISVTALYCFCVELYAMVSHRGVNLGDLLLLFLYTEVVVMAQAAMHSDHDLTIAMPIAIAVVAIGRYMVVGNDHNALHQLMYAGAILILMLALFLWQRRRALLAHGQEPHRQQAAADELPQEGQDGKQH